MKYKSFRQKKEENRAIAMERIEILKSMMESRPQFADRYRRLIERLIKQKYRLNDDSL